MPLIYDVKVIPVIFLFDSPLFSKSRGERLNKIRGIVLDLLVFSLFLRNSCST